MNRMVLYLILLIFLGSCVQQNEGDHSSATNMDESENFETISFSKLSDTFPLQTLTIQQLNSSEYRVVVQGEMESYSCDFDHIGIRSNSNIFVDLSKVDDMFKSYLVVNHIGDTATISCNIPARAYELAVFCSGPGNLAGKYVHRGTK